MPPYRVSTSANISAYPYLVVGGVSVFVDSLALLDDFKRFVPIVISQFQIKIPKQHKGAIPSSFLFLLLPRHGLEYSQRSITIR